MKYQAVIFDFDYTLADSSRGIVTCFQHVLHKHGYTDVADEAIKRTIGLTLEQSFTVLTGVEDARTIAEWKKEYVKEADIHMTANTVIFPDVLTVLKQLKAAGLKIGIVSTKYRYRILDFFGPYLPYDWFDVIIGGEDVTKHKPDAEGLLAALHKMNVERDHALYVGDSVVDAETALRAGTDFVGVSTGMTAQEDFIAYPTLAVIPALSELARMVI